MTAPRNKGQSAARDWLLAHVDHRGADCLSWPFYISKDGFGWFNVAGCQQYAHVFICEKAHGPRPSAAHVAANTCARRDGFCINPEHLAWQTRSALLRDRLAAHRERIASGAAPKRRKPWKLTRAQILRIRALKGKKSQRAIAAMFGVSQDTIWHHQQSPFIRGREQHAIFSALESAARPMTAGEVASAAGLAAKSSAAAILAKLARRKEVERVGRGRYRQPLTREQSAALYAQVGAAIPAAFPHEMRDDIRQAAVLAILEGAASAADIGAAIGAATKHYRKQHPGKFGPMSLDAPLRGTEGLTLLDVLPAMESFAP